MRYKDVIILRITDFRSFFNFADFWAYRNIFSKTTGLRGFWNESLKRDRFIMACHDIVEKWIKNSPFEYVIRDEYKLCKTSKSTESIGKFLKPLVDQVNSFLDSHSELKDRDNCELFLLSLYSLLDRDEQLERFLSDQDVIARILLNERSDFTKEYVEFNDNANITNVKLNCCANTFENHLAHITLIRNRSKYFSVNFIDSLSNDLIFEIDPGKKALAIFNSEGEFIRELPTFAEYYNDGDKITLEIEDTDRVLNLKCTKNRCTYIHRDIVSFSFNDNGYCYVVKDSYKPILFNHSYFDQDEIRFKLKSAFSENEYPLYVEIEEPNLKIRTNKREIEIKC